jgi:hypothetical protein
MNRRMKKLSLLLLVTLIFNCKITSAQTLVNAGFENWTNVILFNEPTGYVSSNYFSIILGTGGLPRANVSKSSGVKHGGTYAAKLESYAQNTGDSLGVPGLLITGSLNIASAAISQSKVNGLTTSLDGKLGSAATAVNASKIGGRTIFVQNATPTAIATGDIWFQVAGL